MAPSWKTEKLHQIKAFNGIFFLQYWSLQSNTLWRLWWWHADENDFSDVDDNDDDIDVDDVDDDDDDGDEFGQTLISLPQICLAIEEDSPHTTIHNHQL